MSNFDHFKSNSKIYNYTSLVFLARKFKFLLPLRIWTMLTIIRKFEKVALMQYPADIFRWQVVTWSWKQLVETFQVMVLLKNFFRKRVTTFDTLQPEINQRPLKNFFWQSLSRWKQDYNFFSFFFHCFPIEFHVEGGGVEEKGFQWRQSKKGQELRTDTKEFFNFYSP